MQIVHSISHCQVAISRLLEEPSLAITLKGVYFIYILLPLHVLALVGHLQAEYTSKVAS
jgi:hypothetical protein